MQIEVSYHDSRFAIHEDGMGTIFVGRLVDPKTGRHVVSCTKCGRPEWFDRLPNGGMYVSVTCSDCAMRALDNITDEEI